MFLNPYNNPAYINILQTKKLLGEGELATDSLSAREWLCWDSNPGLCDCKASCLSRSPLLALLACALSALHERPEPLTELFLSSTQGSRTAKGKLNNKCRENGCMKGRLSTDCGRCKVKEKRGHNGKGKRGVPQGSTEGEGKEGTWVLQSKMPGKES